MFSGERLDEDPYATPLSLVYTSREDGALLARRASLWVSVSVQVDSERIAATSRNVVGDLVGDTWPDEWLVLGAHHDSTIDSPGANDNASGSTVLLETARLLSRLLLRISYTQPADWPQEPLDISKIEERIARERGSVARAT